MRDKNNRFLISVLVIATVVISVIIAFLFNRNLGTMESWFFVIPKVISLELGFYIIFKYYAWKWRLFSRWLVPFPDLTGTWLGKIQSSWINPETKRQIDQIPCMITITHNYKSISIKVYTGEMVSESFSEEIFFDRETNTKRISYTYTSKPNLLLADRSPIHEGTAILELIKNESNMKLKGYYFTGRKTTGEIDVTFKSRKQHDSIPEEVPKHPLAK
ncbi:hypothetical protein KQ51_01197 [Candidatus Izimaplasma bacterium HR1]|jgi:hypothetical protein|uniref:Cap15 family cyclic dinucleotide receptor domain-containing protein n=1 Tax=Candidatus Izimoplasma sp. HR1 TaxID=1541959 RepID=UPI0004F664B3|nr:hypothetical protein KQ51_01197 [Candidatus Izimaplasma bacterium HR1]